MGGTGSGYFSVDPKRLDRDLKESKQSTDAQEYEAEANQALQELLVEFNNRDAATINQYLAKIKDVLREELEDTIDLRFGGSVAKHTYVDGLSDVDSLVLIKKPELVELGPKELIQAFAEQLRGRLRDVQVSEGDLAVTVDFGNQKIQLLPAVKTAQGFRIPNPNGGWADIRPREFAAPLSRQNNELGNKLVPVIKLAKALIGNMPERHRLIGYHTEALALEVFQGYNGPLAYKDMLRHFFAEASKRIANPIRDTTGQSYYVDTYLGAKGSLERTLAADAMDRIARRIRNADNALSPQLVRDLFES